MADPIEKMLEDVQHTLKKMQDDNKAWDNIISIRLARLEGKEPGVDSDLELSRDITPPDLDNPNSYQVGGNWYSKIPGEQHWDRIWRLYGPDKAYVYFVGQVTLYVERYKYKNGIEDLQKARHFLDKLISLEKEEAAKHFEERGIHG